MCEWLPKDVDPASHVSMVRDHLIPGSVQDLLDAFAALGRDHHVRLLAASEYGSLQNAVRESNTLPTLQRRLLGGRNWHNLLAMMWSLVLLERRCREGQYRRRLPADELETAREAVRYMIEQS